MTTKVSKEFMEELRKLREVWNGKLHADALTLAVEIDRYRYDLPHIISYIECEREHKSNDRLHQVITHVTNRFETMFEEDIKCYVAKVGNKFYYTGGYSNDFIMVLAEYCDKESFGGKEALTDEDIEFLQKRYGSENVELIEVK